MKLKIEKRVLQGMLNLAASSDDSRFVLCGIHMEAHPDGRVILVTTDCRVLGAFTAPGLMLEPPKEVLKATVPLTQRKLRPLPTGELLLTFSEKHVQIEGLKANSEGLSLRIKLGEESYPNWRQNWRQIVPSGPFKPMSGALVSEHYLAKFAECARKLRGSDTSGLRQYQTDPLAPMMLEFVGLPELVAVLMPMRSSDPEKEYQLPDWIQAPKPADALKKIVDA